MERMRAGKDYEGMGEGKESGGPLVQTHCCMSKI